MPAIRPVCDVGFAKRTFYLLYFKYLETHITYIATIENLTKKNCIVRRTDFQKINRILIFSFTS